MVGTQLIRTRNNESKVAEQTYVINFGIWGIMIMKKEDDRPLSSEHRN